MTISVLMATYKDVCVAHLQQAFDSIWTNQIRRPDQIVLVVDGAINADQQTLIDNWQELLQNVLVVHKNSQNLGLTKSLNIGLQHITSELIARVDSDDISTPDRFLLQHNYLEAHPEIDILGGSIQEFDESSPQRSIRTYPQTNKDVRKYILKASPVAHPSVMMRHRIFENGLRYDERYPMSQDIALWYDALLAGYQISNLPDVILHFRLSGDVFKRRARKKAKNEFIIYMRGIYRMKGLFTLSYIYPISRYIIRNMPISMVKWFYDSKLRRNILKVK